MFVCFLVLLLGTYIFFLSSFHSLIVLLFVEFLVLGCLGLLFLSYFSWFFSLMFLLVAVCLGAYGVSLLVSTSRRKGSNYYLSF